MQARRILALGQKGAKKFLERYGGQLICSRIRYDEQRRRRGATVEIIVEESGWSPPEKPEIVELRVEFQETEMQHRVKQAGGILKEKGCEMHNNLNRVECRQPES